MSRKITISDLLKNNSFLRWARKKEGEVDAKWEKWRQESQENEELLRDVQLIEKGIPFKKNNAKKGDNWLKLVNRLDQPKVKEMPANSNQYSRRRWLSIAASIAVLVLAIWGTKNYLDTGIKLTYETTFGETKAITLPDGSNVLLGPNSTISFKENFLQNSERIVNLTGESFFNIKKQSDNTTFIVKVKDLSISVIGTEFNVNSHRNASIVSLIEGKVALKKGTHQKVLNPGQTAQFDPKSSSFKITVGQVNYWSAWRFQKWSFGEGTPMKEIVQRIEETFGLTCEIDNPALLERVASGDVSIENPSELFESLGYFLNAKIQQIGSKLIIKEIQEVEK